MGDHDDNAVPFSNTETTSDGYLTYVIERQANARNLYEVLNVPKCATKDEIDDTFEREKKYADPKIQKSEYKISQAAKATLRLNDAYKTLSDGTLRKEYDASISKHINVLPHALHITQGISRVQSDIARQYYRGLSTTLENEDAFESLFTFYQEFRAEEAKWRVSRGNRIFGGTTHFVAAAAGDDYETYSKNVRSRVEALESFDSLILSEFADNIEQYSIALNVWYYRLLNTSDDKALKWLNQLRNEAERISAWVNRQRKSLKWYSDQVNMYLKMNFWDANALHVWTVYQATDKNATPTTALVNSLPHLSEAKVIQLIRDTANRRPRNEEVLKICVCYELHTSCRCP